MFVWSDARDETPPRDRFVKHATEFTKAKLAAKDVGIGASALNEMLAARRSFSTSGARRQSVPSTAQFLAFILNITAKVKGTSSDTAAAAAAAGSAGSYKRSTHPTSVPLNKLLSASFPYSVADSVADFRQRTNPLKFQHELLSLLPFYPTMEQSTGVSSEVLQVPLGDLGNYINEFVTYPRGKDAASDPRTMRHLILVHGYGGGLGFWLKNYRSLALQGWCVHAIDLLGYGCSLRPPFKLREELLDAVEEWFHDSYEQWLRARGLAGSSADTLVVAHLMGAYLMATYGIRRNPAFCRRLMMVLPGAVIRHRTPVEVPPYFARLWERNISPFVLVRKAGPLGSKLVSLWLSRRFANLTLAEQQRLHRYAYAIFQSRGLGEYMLNYLLAPGADARYPLAERGIERLRCSVTWCYGREDWMDPHGGELCSRKLRQRGVDSEVVMVSDAGHHIYLDNTDEFNRLVAAEMRKFPTAPPRRGAGSATPGRSPQSPPPP